LRRMVN